MGASHDNEHVITLGSLVFMQGFLML
jgi:hypothetical protein